ncbi:unnamed protein product, partial [Ectocarpus sp. 8 AP-2014]
MKFVVMLQVDLRVGETLVLAVFGQGFAVENWAWRTIYLRVRAFAFILLKLVLRMHVLCVCRPIHVHFSLFFVSSPVRTLCSGRIMSRSRAEGNQGEFVHLYFILR